MAVEAGFIGVLDRFTFVMDGVPFVIFHRHKPDPTRPNKMQPKSARGPRRGERRGDPAPHGFGP